MWGLPVWIGLLAEDKHKLSIYPSRVEIIQAHMKFDESATVPKQKSDIQCIPFVYLVLCSTYTEAL